MMPRWRRNTATGGAVLSHGGIELDFSPQEWKCFLNGVKAGDFDDMVADRPGRRYTPREAASLLGVQPCTLLVWERQDRIRVDRTVGGHRRYHEAEIERIKAIHRPGQKWPEPSSS